MKDFYVVTNPELGWDCVVGIITGEISDEDEQWLTAHNFILHSPYNVGTMEEFKRGYE